MTNGQESQLVMQEGVVTFCEANPGPTSEFTQFPLLLNELKDINEQIREASAERTEDFGGITTEKKQFKMNMCICAINTAKRLVAFALFTLNSILHEKIKFSESEILSASDVDACDYAQIVFNNADENIEAVSAFGITPTTQVELQNTIQAFTAVIPAPRQGITRKSQLTKMIAVLFDKAKSNLTLMDALVEIGKLSEPNFYNGYFSSRKTIAKGTGKLALKGTVTDALSGEPIKGVTISFVPEAIASLKSSFNSTDAEIVKKSANKGGFNIKIMDQGTYRVILKKAGYTEQIVTVYVNNGEMTIVQVELTKA